MTFRKILPLCLAAGLGGCHRDPAPAPVAQAPVAAVPASAESARRLALIRPDGDRPVDKLILGIQAAAQKNPLKVDAWVALGRAWVRKARETTEPGYYLNADACAE